MVPNCAMYHIYYLSEGLIELTYWKAFESTFPSLQNTSCGNHGSIPQMNATGQCAQPKKKNINVICWRGSITSLVYHSYGYLNS